MIELKDFRRHTDRIVRILIEHALSTEDKVNKIRLSPIGYYDSSELAHSDAEYQ